MVKKDNYTFLTKAPVGVAIATMATPTVISMLITSIYNIADTFFVGKISTQATAAVGVVFPVMAIIQAFGFFFGQGSGTYISRKLGAKENDNAGKMATTAFFCSFAFGLLITIIGLLFLTPISRMLGSTPSILPYTEDFLGIVLLGCPFMTASMTLNNQLRFQGSASYAMIGIVAGAFLNVLAVPFFTFTLDMGIQGTAIGTVIGQIISFIILLAMTRRGGNITIRLKDFSKEKIFYNEILKGGTPSLSRQGLASIATLLLNIAAGMYGDEAIAGMSIVSRISFVVFSIIIGIGQGFQPLCGFNYGAKQFDRVKEGFLFCIKVDLIFLLFCCIPGFIFAEETVYVLLHDADVVRIGAEALRWQIITYPLAAIITISNMTLQTSGRTIGANILASARNGLFFIPLILLLPSLMGLKGVEISQAAADLFSFILTVPIMMNYFKSIGQPIFKIETK